MPFTHGKANTLTRPRRPSAGAGRTAPLGEGVTARSPRRAGVRAFEGHPSALPKILALRKDSARLVRPDAMLIGLGLGTPITEGRDELSA